MPRPSSGRRPAIDTLKGNDMASFFTLTLTKPDEVGSEPVELEVGSRDIAAWEMSYKGATLKGLLSDIAVSKIYQLAHAAMRRQGKIPVEMSSTEFMKAYELDIQKLIDTGQAEDAQTPFL